MAFRSSASIDWQEATTLAVPIPSGSQAGDIAEVAIFANISGESGTDVTPPSGFALKAHIPHSVGSNGSGRIFVFWKRLTEAESGTWTFSKSGSQGWQAISALYSGRVETGDPYDDIDISGTTTGSTSPTLSLSTSVAGCDLSVNVHNWNNETGREMDSPWVDRLDGNWMGLFTQDSVGSGEPGNTVVTGPGADDWWLSLSALLPDDSEGTQYNETVTDAATATDESDDYQLSITQTITDTASATDAIDPGGDPPNFQVSVSGSTAHLTWDESPTVGVEDYSVFRRSPQTGEPFDPEVDTPVASGVEAEFYDDEGLTPGDYDWQVFGRIPG